MTHDKVRQDFEATKGKHQCCRLKYDQNYAKAGDYYLEQTRTEFAGYCAGYQAGRAAERAEIREKLESTETLYEVTYGLRGLGWKNNAERAKAAITKILEVI